MEPLVNQFGDLSNAEINRYGRHLIMPEFGMDGQRRLKASSVLIIGTGGLGSPLALYLAAAGIGRIGLVDYDVVEETNLQRQIVHGQSSIGMTKVDSAELRLRDLNPGLIIDKYNVPLTSDNAIEILTPYDVIIDGTDNFPTRYLVNDACVKLGKPNVYGSILRFEGQLSVFYAKEGPCYRCMFPEPPPPGLVPNCAEAGVLGVLPGVIGTMQATEAIKLITGIGVSMVGRMLLYDASDMTFTNIKVRKNPNCPVCSIPHEQVELIDYEEFCGVPAHDNIPAPATVMINGNNGANGNHAHNGNNGNKPMQAINVQQLKEKYDSGDSLYVLDVRNPEEFEIAVMPDTVKIPKPQIQLAVEDVKSGRKTADQTVLAQIPRDREVIVHCRSGKRSADVIELLVQVGYNADNLINVEGGILAWARQIDTSLPTY